MTIQTEKETKRSGLTLYNLPVTKKKKLVMSLHNTSKNTFFFVENKINRLVVRWVCDNNHNTNKDNFYFYFLKKIDFIIQIVKNKKQKLHKSYREYKEEKTLSK